MKPRVFTLSYFVERLAAQLDIPASRIYSLLGIASIVGIAIAFGIFYKHTWSYSAPSSQKEIPDAIRKTLPQNLLNTLPPE